MPGAFAAGAFAAGAFAGGVNSLGQATAYAVGKSRAQLAAEGERSVLSGEMPTDEQLEAMDVIGCRKQDINMTPLQSR